MIKKNKEHFYIFIKSLPKLYLFVLLYEWKNTKIEVLAKEPRYCRWDIPKKVHIYNGRSPKYLRSS